jgi:hypothetical protein
MLELNCFGTNYIGIRGDCDETEPTSGLYINDLPGISLKLASHLADEEVTGVTLIRRFEQQAIRMVWNNVKTKLSKNIILSKVVSQLVTDRFEPDSDEVDWLAPVAANVGIEVEKNDYDPYTSLRVNYVDIRANTTATGEVLTITDGPVVKTYNFDIQAGKPVRIFTNYEACTDEVRITVNGTNLALENLLTNRGRNCGSCGDRCSSCACNECISVNGWDGAKEVTQAYGIIANVSCVCTQSPILCSLQQEIAEAVQMKLGVLLMMERLASSRVNYLVQNGKEEAKTMLMSWQGGIDLEAGIETKSEYWRLISQIAESIKNSLLHQTSACIACGKVRAVETLP